MKVFYSDPLSFPLPEGHQFPLRKFALLRQAVVAAGLVRPEDLILPEPLSDEQILRAHDPAYLDRVKAGRLSAQEIRRLGLPWSPQLVERVRYASGGTLAACRAALEDGVAVNLGGGTHHAFRDYGQGFCVFNDVVIAARALQAEVQVRRVAVLDCDVHQGNGTAALTAGDATVYTLSVHNADNFPLHKVPSDLDIGLRDGAGDAEFLQAVEEGVTRALAQAGAGLAIYLAGADPYERDLLGRLAVSREGLAARDRLVLGMCRDQGLPVAVIMAGGYCRDPEDTVEVHLQTVRIAAETARAWANRPRSLRASPSPVARGCAR